MEQKSCFWLSSKWLTITIPVFFFNNYFAQVLLIQKCGTFAASCFLNVE